MTSISNRIVLIVGYFVIVLSSMSSAKMVPFSNIIVKEVGRGGSAVIQQKKRAFLSFKRHGKETSFSQDDYGGLNSERATKVLNISREDAEYKQAVLRTALTVASAGMSKLMKHY
jgi:hypothetical protein